MRISAITLLALLLLLLAAPQGVAQRGKNTLVVDPEVVGIPVDRSMLLGTNAGIYYEESYFMNPDLIHRLRELNPGIIRMPGGSWSNELYWNGNRVRISEESYIPKGVWDSTKALGGNPMEVAFDTSRYANGRWDVDYSGYAPGFRIRDTKHRLSDFHGFTDVLFLHKFIESLGAATMVTVNAGTGSVEMAVEWVRWTRQRERYLREPFHVTYWEVGNELDGAWELGHYLPDGSAMNATEYVVRYKQFASAMKEADPTIKVGGSVASSMELAFVEELIRDTVAPLDFISFHAYPSHNDDVDLGIMMGRAEEIRNAVNRIDEWLAAYRPLRSDSIGIVVSEWNIKVKEDLSTVDLRNAVWSSMMIGEMASAGVDVAMQWDLFSTTPEGGHGMFNPLDPVMSPRSQYWACYLWSRYMGDRMVKTTLEAPGCVRAYSMVDSSHVSIMVINGSGNDSIALELHLAGISGSVEGEEVSFSEEQYQIDPLTLIPVRSEAPAIGSLLLRERTVVDMAPCSIKVIRYPKQENKRP